nr:N-acetylglucosamine-1-phosphodiester alpha-N-acetylglucosaminidase-like [Crassostrea gigas]
MILGLNFILQLLLFANVETYFIVMGQAFAKVCMTGYFGPNCDIPCRFPSYGESCQSECRCEKQQCNHITGCENETKTTSDESNSMVTKVSSTFGSNVLYIPYEIVTTTPGLQHHKTMWAGLNVTHKFMLISICIIGLTIFVMTGMYVICNKRRNTLIKYSSQLHPRRKLSPRNVTSTL